MTDATYVIRVRGALSAETLNALPELCGEAQGSDTVLTCRLQDSSAFYGLMARLDALGLDLLDVLTKELS
jgi:hypothetical protein